MAKIGLTVFAATRGEKISIAINSGDQSGDISLTPIEALSLAAGLASNARTSMFGSKEDPDESLDPQLVMAGEALDQVAFSLEGLASQLPR